MRSIREKERFVVAENRWIFGILRVDHRHARSSRKGIDEVDDDGGAAGTPADYHGVFRTGLPRNTRSSSDRHGNLLMNDRDCDCTAHPGA